MGRGTELAEAMQAERLLVERERGVEVTCLQQDPGGEDLMSNRAQQGPPPGWPGEGSQALASIACWPAW